MTKAKPAVVRMGHSRSEASNAEKSTKIIKVAPIVRKTVPAGMAGKQTLRDKAIASRPKAGSGSGTKPPRQVRPAVRDSPATKDLRVATPNTKKVAIDNQLNFINGDLLTDSTLWGTS